MKSTIKLAAVIAVAALLQGCGFEVVDTGYRGVKTTFGEVQGEPLPEGLHFYNPMTSDITEISVREFNLNERLEAFTKDNQAVHIDVEFVWSIEPAKVGVLFSEVGREDNIEKVRVKNNFLGALKDSIGKQDADTIIQNRDRAANFAIEEARKKLTPLGVVAHSLNFSNMALNKEYQNAVEEKMIAKQLAEKSKNETVRIEEEAKQQVKTAEAEATAMRIKSQALAQNKGLVEFEMVQKWDGKLPQYMFGNSIPMINFDKLSKD